MHISLPYGRKLLSDSKKRDLFIPIYLDTNTLLDILASIEGGFSVAEKITSSSADSKRSQQSGGGEFGVAAVFSIFKLNLKGESNRARERKTEESYSTERFHTYGSLLNKLRSILEDDGLLKEVTSNESWQSAKPSDFVEIQGKFVPNPLRKSMETLVEIIDFMFLREGLPKVKIPDNTSQNEMFKEIRNLIDGLAKDFEPESTQTYIVELSGLPENRVVVKLFPEYIRDRSGRELPYGEFTMLGKVIRKIDKGDAINLIQGSVFSSLSDEFTSKFLGDLYKGLEGSGIKIPQMIKSVNGPAIQIIPIAIYV
jgi:hypothetical protein